jgi:tetratricopeptide (TPR) repeat protein
MMQTGALNIPVGQAAYVQYMNAGATAMALRRWADAVAAYGAALRLVPNSVDATVGLAQAETNLARELKNRTALTQLLERGANQYRQGNYADSARAYKDALLIDPDNAIAIAGLRQARYSEHMAAGNNNMRSKNYTTAMRDFEAALREVPGDPAATQSWQQARALSMKK